MAYRYDANSPRARRIPSCAPDGLRQAELLAQYLESEHIDAVYASPMARARQTAEPLAERLQMEIRISPGVAEWDQNSPEYVPVEELKAANDPRWHAMLAGEWSSDESEEDFRARVLDAVEAIVDDHRGEKVAVVCHGGIINGYLSHILGLGEFARGFFYPNYTSINRVAAASSGERSIVTVNETSHLRGTGLPMGLFQRG